MNESGVLCDSVIYLSRTVSQGAFSSHACPTLPLCSLYDLNELLQREIMMYDYSMPPIPAYILCLISMNYYSVCPYLVTSCELIGFSQLSDGDYV